MVKLDATDITIVVRIYNASSIVIHIVTILVYVKKSIFIIKFKSTYIIIILNNSMYIY